MSKLGRFARRSSEARVSQLVPTRRRLGCLPLLSERGAPDEGTSADRGQREERARSTRAAKDPQERQKDLCLSFAAPQSLSANSEPPPVDAGFPFPPGVRRCLSATTERSSRPQTLECATAELGAPNERGRQSKARSPGGEAKRERARGDELSLRKQQHPRAAAL